MTLPFAIGAMLVSSGLAVGFAVIATCIAHKDEDTKRDISEKFACFWTILFLPVFLVIMGLRLLFS